MNVIRVLKGDSGTDNVMMEAEAGVIGRGQGMKVASEAGKDNRGILPWSSQKNHPTADPFETSRLPKPQQWLNMSKPPTLLLFATETIHAVCLD